MDTKEEVMAALLESQAALAAANARADAATKRAIEQERLRIEEFDYLCDGRIQDDDIRLALVTSNRERDALRDDLARVTADLTKSQERRAVAEDQASGLFAQNVRLLADLATARAEAEALKTRLHDANNALFVASAKKSMAEKSVRELVAGLRECRMHAVGYAPESLVAKLDALLAKHANGGAS